MANWLQLCRTPGSEHRHLIANMELHLSPPPGRHGEQEKYAQHAKDMPAGMVGGALHGETGAEGRWGGDVALTVGRGFQSNGSTAKLGFWSVYERKQEANRAGGALLHMSACFAVLTAGTSSFLTSSTALLILISALDCVSSTVSRT